MLFFISLRIWKREWQWGAVYMKWRGRSDSLSSFVYNCTNILSWFLSYSSTLVPNWDTFSQYIMPGNVTIFFWIIKIRCFLPWCDYHCYLFSNYICRLMFVLSNSYFFIYVYFICNPRYNPYNITLKAFLCVEITGEVSYTIDVCGPSHPPRLWLNWWEM